MSTWKLRALPLIAAVIMVTVAGCSSGGGSAAIITGQLKGRVDIGAGSYIPYIAAQAAGARFRILSLIHI